MYTLIRLVDGKGLVRQVIPVGCSLLIAESFYKFGSFSLEFLAFLGTWYAADLVFTWLARFVREAKHEP